MENSRPNDHDKSVDQAGKISLRRPKEDLQASARREFRLGNGFERVAVKLFFENWKCFNPRRELRKQTQTGPFDGVFFI